MSTRKRRRSQAFPTEENDAVVQEELDSELGPEDVDPVDEEGQDEHGEDVELELATEERCLERELEIWEAVREEHHGIIEQLPLSLHRQYRLIGELDKQTQDNMVIMLSTLRQYYQARKTIEYGPNTSAHEAVAVQGDDAMVVDDPKDVVLDVENSISSTREHGQTHENETTSSMLRNIALLLDNMYDASEEKLTLARAAQYSVDRYLRLLDQAIKEQEASISTGVSSDTHISVPELIMPPYMRVGRAASPDSDLGIDGLFKTATPSKHSTTTKVTLMIQSPALEASRSDDPSKKYCYCKKISLGDMVGCDNTNCPIEWFHLACVNLTKAPPPESEWYCKECTASMKKGTAKKTKTRRRR